MTIAALHARLGAEVAMSVAKLAAIVAVILFVFGFAAVQSVRIDGFGLSLPIVGRVGIEGWKPRAQKAERDLANFRSDVVQAQAEATFRARQQRETFEDRYEQLAKEADRNEELVRGEAMAAADRYIYRNAGAVCMQPDPVDRGPRGTARTATEDRGAGLPAPVSADPLVPVAASDVRACAGAVSYALEARRFVLDLEAASAAEVGDGE